MVDPRFALLVFAALSALASVVVWPRRGLLARLRQMRQASDRVRLEDTLKYLFHRNTAGEPVHADALAGALGIGRTDARRTLTRLDETGLATLETGGARLTESGRREAIRIVRSHRLLERYFADRTGVSPAEWHELAMRLGQPRYDPHGDPIPTATGELPSTAGMPLAALAEGEAGTIVHLEDEPREDYERLTSLGLKLGGDLVQRGRTGDALIVEFEGRLLKVPFELVDAVNVTRGVATGSERPRTLADLSSGEGARVIRISSECRGAQRRRLLDLGVVPGTEIISEMRSAGGDPTAYRIRGALIALRRQQAEWIEVEAVTKANGSEAAA